MVRISTVRGISSGTAVKLRPHRTEFLDAAAKLGTKVGSTYQSAPTSLQIRVTASSSLLSKQSVPIGSCMHMYCRNLTVRTRRSCWNRACGITAFSQWGSASS